MVKPLNKSIIKIKQWFARLNLTIEKALVIALILVVSSISYTAYLAYQSFIQLTEAVGRGSESEVKMLLIKGISGDLAAAESNIKSYGLSRDKSYLGAYHASIQSARIGLTKLDSLIAPESKQQQTFDSMSYYMLEKIEYLQAFAGIQERGSVVNELNVLSRQIEENKKLLAYYLGERGVEARKKEEQQKPGFFKRVFSGKSIQKAEADRKNKELKDATTRLGAQIKMMEKVKGEIGQVKRRQGSTLKDIDKKELSITQQNKALSEKVSAWVVSLEMDELANTRLMIEDIDRRHNKTDKLIGVFSLTGAIFLIIIGYVVYTFISRKNSYQAALLEAKNEAEQYSLLQEQFLANMSHEIRTPMNAIAGFTEQLLKTSLQNNQRTFVDIIHQSVGYLLVVVNDILDYAKLKADKLTIEELPFSVLGVTEEAALLLQETAKSKGLQLEVYAGKNLPDIVVSDPVRFKQIMLNLMGNALKFTSHGQITVTVNCIEQTPDLCSIQVRIQDTGIGISASNLDRIFNAFEQAERSIARKYGGSGLGLSITQKLVRLLNGTIALTSKEGQGTEVVMLFRWPVQQSISPTVASPAFTMDLFASTFKDKTVLIADDEEWNVQLLTVILDAYGIAYQTARNGKEVLEIISNHKIDLVLMDVRMPEMDGFEATRAIRKLSGVQHKIPVMGITADTTGKQIQRCYDSGMNAVLSKPFRQAILAEKMVTTLTQSSAKQPSLPEMTEQPRTASKKQPYSIAVLEEMGKGDSAFMIKMLRIFMENGDQTFKQMPILLNERKWNEIADLAHKMMPATRQLEADNLLAQLKQIEKTAMQKHTSGLDELIRRAADEFKAIYKSMEKTIEHVKNS